MGRPKYIGKKECILYYSCHNENHQFRTGLIVNNSMRHLVMDFQPISFRLCKIRIKVRYHNYSLFRVHVPTVQKEDLYDLLEKEYDKCPRHNIKLILGDFNAKNRVIRKLKTYYRYIQFTQRE